MNFHHSKKNMFFILLICLIGFQQMIKAQDELNNSLIAFTIPEKDLLPESVAYDKKTNSFYVGSTRKGKVIRIAEDGTQTDFIKPKQDGLWMIIGIKVDAERRHLWLCSSGGDNLIGYQRRDDVEGRPAGIFKFNLDNGKLIQKYVIDEAGKGHFFNDLAIARNGDVYATHMFEEASIYKIDSKTGEMEKFAQDASMKFPNGLTLADNGKDLFIAHSEGLAKLNLNTRQIIQLKSPDGVSISGRESFDGLYYYKWSIIGVKSDTKQIVQLKLNDDGSGFDQVWVLERDHPMMNRPTTGVLIGNELFYIANAQFDNFNDDGSLFPMQRMYEPVILKVALRQ